MNVSNVTEKGEGDKKRDVAKSKSGKKMESTIRK